MADTIDKILSRFYVKLPGSSKKTKTIGAEVPIDYDRWLAEVAASKDFPEYKTKSDIVRDCIHLGLTLRTDPKFRDAPELQHLRKGILALQRLENISNLRATVDEICAKLYLAHPNTRDGQMLLEESSDFLSGLEDPGMKHSLNSAIEAFRNR